MVASEGRAAGWGADLEAAFLQTAAQLEGTRTGSETDTLSLIVSSAAATVPGAEHAGVSLLERDGSITSYTFSDDTIAMVDQLQSTYREGPCVSALWEQHTVSVDDLTAEAWRWPRFAPRAAAAGIGSMLSFQLYAREDTLGSLNLYSSKTASFTRDSVTLGELFAMQAASSLGQARKVAHLHHALETRDVIGQAKGILMERFGLDAEQAFTLLARSSQETNIKLVTVARWLTNGGDEEK